MAQADIAKHNSPIPNDVDPAETAEWLESLDYVLERKGPERVQQLLATLEEAAIRNGVELPFTATTPYVNTIPHDKEPRYPGKRELERRIKSFIRWNAMAMVTRANRDHSGINHGCGYDDKPPPGCNSRRKLMRFSSVRRPSRNARLYMPGEAWP